MVKTILEMREKEKVKKEDASQARKVWIFKKNDDPYIIHEVTFPDLTPEDFKKFTTNYVETIKNVMALAKDAPKVTFEILPDVEGRPLIFQLVDPGVPLVSKRCTLISTYQFVEAGAVPNEHSFMASTRQNDSLKASMKAKIGKAVAATLEVNYYNFKPTEDGKGTRCLHVMCSKPEGSIPGFVVNKMTEKQADALLGVATIVRGQVAAK